MTAALGDEESAKTVIATLCANAGDIWRHLLAHLPHHTSSDLVTEGFLLGIDQGAVLTRLGTYAHTFLGDDDLARTLYEVAVQHDPKNPVALTNLARALVRVGDDNSLRKAQRLLSQAQAFSGPRFNWWRNVQDQLRAIQEERRPKTASSSPDFPSGPVKVPSGTVDTIPALAKRYNMVRRLVDEQSRGYELEKLIYNLVELTLSIKSLKRPHRVERLGGDESQIDLFFEYRNDQYRVECKWKRSPVAKNDIVVFLDKLDVANVQGLFISMSGFEESALTAARRALGTKRLILMDGEEVEAVMKGRLHFDLLLDFKRTELGFKSNPYAKIETVMMD